MDNLIKTSRLRSFLFLTLLLFTEIGNAAVIKGRVTDSETHKPIPGAAISIVGTNIVSVADSKGNYSFTNLKPGTYKIIGSCMGYKSSTPQKTELATAASNVTIDVFLAPSVVQMNEVVVNGIQNKESNASARTDERISSNIVSIISAKTIENLPDLNVANILQRVSGVSMMKNSSGNNTQLVIRGMAPRYNSTLVNS